MLYGFTFALIVLLHLMDQTCRWRAPTRLVLVVMMAVAILGALFDVWMQQFG
jgi:hypothetical protein